MNLSPIMTLILVQAIGQQRGASSSNQGRALAVALVVRPPVLGLLLALGLENSGSSSANSNAAGAGGNYRYNPSLPIPQGMGVDHVIASNGVQDQYEVSVSWKPLGQPVPGYVVFRAPAAADGSPTALPAPVSKILAWDQDQYTDTLQWGSSPQYAYCVSSTDNAGNVSFSAASAIAAKP
jgi:hypothetical protein